MDKQFEKVIQKMDEQSNKAVELQKHVSSLFTKVESTQGDIDKKIDKVNKDLEKVLGGFEVESERIFKDVKSEFDKLKTDVNKSSQDKIKELGLLKEEYQENVSNLIQSIDKKSNKILKIYNELENIKKTQKDAIKTFGEIADNQKKATATFTKESQELLTNTDLGSLLHIVESFESRLAKMEKYAHKHSFGGTKV